VTSRTGTLGRTGAAAVRAVPASRGSPPGGAGPPARRRAASSRDGPRAETLTAPAFPRRWRC